MPPCPFSRLPFCRCLSEESFGRVVWYSEAALPAYGIMSLRMLFLKVKESVVCSCLCVVNRYMSHMAAFGCCDLASALCSCCCVTNGSAVLLCANPLHLKHLLNVPDTSRLMHRHSVCVGATFGKLDPCERPLSQSEAWKIHEPRAGVAHGPLAQGFESPLGLLICHLPEPSLTTHRDD